ncbi:flavin-monooxygenase glucosinolate S-oxygenase 3 [Striga asiatica]|uniref:Flavin-monooxygenase glucosinolate S-oxygenase 3 n=1 Tax=Striga asiatica TaxID=4170 RepID=A0A5A7PD26_STRAF|nr:flavin-monooxygenase glucosinolate S-oxygenase 3 [Striga asiatica]
MDSLSPSGSQNGREARRRYLTKALFKVNIQNSLGPVQVVMQPENTAAELTKAAIAVYVKERRRPLLGSVDPGCYDLHYSQFNLESLKPEEKLEDLGSRNFFLCPKFNLENTK